MIPFGIEAPIAVMTLFLAVALSTTDVAYESRIVVLRNTTLFLGILLSALAYFGPANGQIANSLLSRAVFAVLSSVFLIAVAFFPHQGASLKEAVIRKAHLLVGFGSALLLVYLTRIL